MDPVLGLLFLPLVAAPVVVCLPRQRPELIRGVVRGTGVGLLLLAGWLVIACAGAPGTAGQVRCESVLPLLSNPTAGITARFGVDGLSLCMVVLCCVVGAAALWMGCNEPDRAGGYHALLLLIIAGVLGAFTARDFFYMYVFHELALVPTFILMVKWGRGTDKTKAAYQTAIYLTVGALLVLVGLIWYHLVPGVGTFELCGAGTNPPPVPVQTQYVLCALFLVGFGILASVWPFYGWAPDCYATAPVPAAMLHAGALKMFGLYGLIRAGTQICPEPMTTLGPVLAWLGAANLVFNGLVAWRQRELNRLIAHGTVAHVGVVLLGVAAWSELGLLGATLAMLANGVWAALGYAVIGLAERVHGTTDVEVLARGGGLVGFLRPVLIIVAFAGVGLPGFATFAGELVVLLGAWEHPLLHAAVAVTVPGMFIVSAVYLLGLVRRVVHVPAGHRPDGVNPVLSERLAVLLLVVMLVLPGVYPSGVGKLLGSAGADATPPSSVQAAAGFNPDNDIGRTNSALCFDSAGADARR